MNRMAGGDLVVVIPGILGSHLERRGEQVWGYRRLAHSLPNLASRLTEQLTLPPEAFHDPAQGCSDGVMATRLMRRLAIVPGFASVDGYDRLLAWLRKKFRDDPDAIIEFPFDWRQSNEYSARELKCFAEPLLARRRAAYPGARLVLLAHSMGGLVARYYAECLDDRALTRRVITLGTPFSGSVKALTLLANGFVPLGPVKFELGELARSLPSVAELLPTYACWGESPESLRGLGDGQEIVSLPAVAWERCRTFHRQIADAVRQNGDQRPTYHALLSHRQKTDLWALLGNAGEVVPQSSEGMEDAGDGTVTRRSAVPPDWSEDAAATFVVGKHSSLPSQRAALVQIHGILTSTPRREQVAADEISVDAPVYVDQDGRWDVEARSLEGADSLVLSVDVEDPEAHTAEPVLTFRLRSVGNGRYAGGGKIKRAGTFRWTVRSEHMAATPVEPVVDVLFCGAAM